MSHRSTDQATRAAARTTVTVKPTGLVRREIGEASFEFSFSGETLRDLLDALFEEYPALEGMLIAETDADAATEGWAPAPDELPGTWEKNPEGENTRAYVRVTVNGRFNEHLDGLDTTLSDGDRVALMYPFIFCC